MIRELSDIGYLKIGETDDDRKYGLIVHFSEHQVINKKKESKIKCLEISWFCTVPVPDEYRTDTVGVPPGIDQGKGVEGNREEERKQLSLLPSKMIKPKNPKGSQLPDDWKHNEGHVKLSRELGVNIDNEALKFREHAIATGRIMKNWDMTFNTWLRRSKEFVANRGGKPPVPTQGNHGLTGWETEKTW
jgi:hypothetical protein